MLDEIVQRYILYGLTSSGILTLVNYHYILTLSYARQTRATVINCRSLREKAYKYYSIPILQAPKSLRDFVSCTLSWCPYPLEDDCHQSPLSRPADRQSSLCSCGQGIPLVLGETT